MFHLRVDNYKARVKIRLIQGTLHVARNLLHYLNRFKVYKDDIVLYLYELIEVFQIFSIILVLYIFELIELSLIFLLSKGKTRIKLN